MLLFQSQVRHLAVLIGLVLSSSAYSQVLPPGQNCVIAGDLHGDSRHFWFWGRDSWIGVVRVSCNPIATSRMSKRPNLGSPLKEEKEIEVAIRFSPWSPGVGAGHGHTIKIRSERFSIEELNSLYGTFRTYTKVIPLILGRVVQVQVEMNREGFRLNLSESSSGVFTDSEIEGLVGTGQISIERVEGR